jgi:NTP pyrophosphatase (non-canonical NTP hydrolase)
MIQSEPMSNSNNWDAGPVCHRSIIILKLYGGLSEPISNRNHWATGYGSHNAMSLVANTSRPPILASHVDARCSRISISQAHSFTARSQDWTLYQKGQNLMFYAELIRRWAEDRNLIRGSDVKSQFVKLIEEAGELANAIAKKNDIEFADAIGDMVVVLTIMAAQNGMMIEDCIDNAWQEIKDRKGKMVDGIFIKESS